MTALGGGSRFNQDAVLQALVLYGVRRALHEHLQGVNDMREVKELAAGMRELMASLRKDNADAKQHFMSEVERAKVNAGKLKSVAEELSVANREVEEVLGETGSNFPPSSGGSDTQPPALKADINGVTKNTETPQ